ncbi:MAG: M15 family metallopeptidase [Nocardioides sp.]
MRSGTPALVAGLLTAGLLAGCGDQAERRATTPIPSIPGDRRTETSPTDKPSSRPSPTPSQSPAPAPGTTPPPWLGSRMLPTTGSGFGEVRKTPRALRHRRFTLPDTVPALPGEGFSARVTAPAPRAVIARSSWRPRCPVGAGELTWLRLAFWGFDDRRHTGELLVHEDVARDLESVFARLYAVRFPMEELSIVTRHELDAPPTGDGNSTTAFACRPTTGGTRYSQHAYGLAVDVNTFQNPYVLDDLVIPERASAYLARERVRPGMVTAEGPVVSAFRDIGWEWGGDWTSLKDYQHFSENGR